MATSTRPDVPHRSFALRAATALVAGGVCAAVAGTTPAAAEEQPFTTPVGQLPGQLQLPSQLTDALGLGPDPLAAFGFGTPALPPPAAPVPPPAPPDLVGMVTSALGIAPLTPLPAPAPQAPAAATPRAATPVTPAVGSAPAPTAPAAEPVAEVPATAEQVRIGHLTMGRPGIVTPEQAAEINGGAAGFENALSDVLDSNGVDPRRSDVIAARVIGDAAVGAVLGVVAIAPVASLAAIAGGAIGFLVGIPFLPTGRVI